MKKLIAGNWKMNMTLDGTRQLIANIVNDMHDDQDLMDKCDFAVFPPALYLAAVRHSLHGFPYISFGMQNVSMNDDGAHTGDLSASMAQDSSCSYVIVGHSERRADHGETNEIVNQKAAQLISHDIAPIICVGETLVQREAGGALDVVEQQVRESVPDHKNFNEVVIAYEPVWAIGTGKVPSLNDIDEMHAHIHRLYKSLFSDNGGIRVLYGGSLKPDNAAEILALKGVNGGLIGGASIDAKSFLGIARAV